MGVDIERLGPAAQAQVKAELARRQRETQAAQRKKLAEKGPVLQIPATGSKLEEEYYRRCIWPKELLGQIVRVERQKRFDLLPKSEYCGLALPAVHYTPDFVIEYANGQVEAVEVKHCVIRKLQRDYTYRRRLFIDLIARPKGWIFTEYIKTEEET